MLTRAGRYLKTVSLKLGDKNLLAVWACRADAAMRKGEVCGIQCGRRVDPSSRIGHGAADCLCVPWLTSNVVALISANATFNRNQRDSMSEQMCDTGANTGSRTRHFM